MFSKENCFFMCHINWVISPLSQYPWDSLVCAIELSGTLNSCYYPIFVSKAQFSLSSVFCNHSCPHTHKYLFSQSMFLQHITHHSVFPCFVPFFLYQLHNFPHPLSLTTAHCGLIWHFFLLKVKFLSGVLFLFQKLDPKCYKVLESLLQCGQERGEKS